MGGTSAITGGQLEEDEAEVQNGVDALQIFWHGFGWQH